MSTNDTAALERAATTADAITTHRTRDARGRVCVYYRCEQCGDEHTNRRRLARRCGCYDG